MNDCRALLANGHHRTEWDMSQLNSVVHVSVIVLWEGMGDVTLTSSCTLKLYYLLPLNNFVEIKKQTENACVTSIWCSIRGVQTRINVRVGGVEWSGSYRVLFAWNLCPCTIFEVMVTDHWFQVLGRNSCWGQGRAVKRNCHKQWAIPLTRRWSKPTNFWSNIFLAGRRGFFCFNGLE